GGDDGQVDEEDRAPVEVSEEVAAGDGADGATGTGHARPDGDGPSPFVHGEDIGEDGQGGRHHEGAADAHDRPADDQLVGGVADAGKERAQAEDGEADVESALAPEAVAQGSAREQQPGEDEAVGVDDPLQLGVGGLDVAHQGGDGDVQGGVAHHHHEQ